MNEIIGLINILIKPIKFMFLYFSNKKEQKYNQIVKLYKLINSNKNKKILLVSELFKDLTSLKLSYNNIKTLLEDENALIIIYLLRNYKNLYDYDNNKFISLENEKFKNLKKWFLNIFLISTIISIAMIAFYIANTDSLIDKLIYAILLFFFLVYLIMYIKMNEDIKLADKIIKVHVNNKDIKTSEEIINTYDYQI